MIEAWLILAAFALANLVCGFGSFGRKLRHILVGVLVALVVSLAWMTVVTLTNRLKGRGHRQHDLLVAAPPDVPV
jgi:hypothetical protein